MQAVQVADPNVIQISDVPVPQDGDETLVRIHQVGICGTDTKILQGKIPVDYPRIMGHEMIGEIAASPPDGPYRVGTRVLIDPGVSCGECHLCRAGRSNLCIAGGLLGRDVDGVFTEFITAPTDRLVEVPEHITDKEAGLLQVLGTCVHAVKRVNPSSGQVAAVNG